MPLISHFGIVTIATNWVFVIIALGVMILAFLLALPRGRERHRLIKLEDYINWTGFTIGLALACQTTWAIVLEGHGEHQVDFQDDQVNVLARVRWVLTLSEQLS
jgi:hypothetical protein